MLKKLKISASLIIIGELLSWSLNYFSNNTSNFGEFTTGILLGLSVGMKLLGIILLLFYIVKYKEKKWIIKLWFIFSLYSTFLYHSLKFFKNKLVNNEKCRVNSV